MAEVVCDSLEIKYPPDYQLNADFVLSSGYVWQVVGPNSSGKTTLLSQLLFRNGSSDACAKIDGIPISRLAIGCLNYDCLFGKWSVRKNVEYILTRVIRDFHSLSFAPRLIPFRWWERSLYLLSNAQRKRVLIAALIECDMSTIILDEYDDALDDETLSLVSQVLCEWVQDRDGRTVLVSCKRRQAAFKTIEIFPSEQGGWYCDYVESDE